MALERISKCLEDLGNGCNCKVRTFFLALATSFLYLRGPSYREEPGQGHWYPSVFKNPEVKVFLGSILNGERPPPRCSATFTLTTAIPAETGSLHGWRILKLVVPGRWVSITTIPLPYDELSTTARLGRLTVERGDSTVSVVTCNVGCFSVDAAKLENRRLDIDGYTLTISHHVLTASTQLYFHRDSSSRWAVGFPLTTVASQETHVEGCFTDPLHGRITTTGRTTIHESILDPAFLRTSQNRDLYHQ